MSKSMKALQSSTRRAFALGFALTFLFGGGVASAQPTPDRFVSFSEFVQAVRSATLSKYGSAPDVRVGSVGAFDEMRRHVLEIYDSVHVTHSYMLDSQYFDCVPIIEQPSARQLGLTSIDTTPPSLPQPAGRNTGRAGEAPAVQVAVGQKSDQFGNRIPCESGTIPFRRITLEELARFKTLRDFFKKRPDGLDQGRAAATHKYADAYQDVANHGGGQFINLWDPAVNTGLTHIFSLAQHWFSNYRSDGKVQTAEGGWQDYPGKYGVTKPVLFIYWTADGYNATGCYNLDCKGFVQTNPNVHLGAGFSNYSTQGGTQYFIEVHWFLSGGKWWFYLGGVDAAHAVGYYPASLYASGPLATRGSEIDYGGETVGTTNWPQMGGGRFPNTGFGHAAYQRTIHYYTTGNGYDNATLTPSQPSPSCYKIKLFNNSSNTTYRTYFYFGGPGGTGC